MFLAGQAAVRRVRVINFAFRIAIFDLSDSRVRC